jgi:long-chain acyl-CoA synthetase
MSGRVASGLLTAGLDRSDTVAVGEIMIRGGFNVYPREIEEVLHEHPSVVEAAVIGRPDDRLGEEVVAFIALKKGATAAPDDVIDFCKERLAAYKYPREVVVLDELPKGGSGKVLKTELRASL